jgi:hypothetical protein
VANPGRANGAYSHNTATRMVQDEPGGRILQDSALQGDRRAPSTLAAGDEPPMNLHEVHEDG